MARRAVPPSPHYFASIEGLRWLSSSSPDRSAAESMAIQRAKARGFALLHMRIGFDCSTVGTLYPDGTMQPLLFRDRFDAELWDEADPSPFVPGSLSPSLCVTSPDSSEDARQLVLFHQRTV